MPTVSAGSLAGCYVGARNVVLSVCAGYCQRIPLGSGGDGNRCHGPDARLAGPCPCMMVEDRRVTGSSVLDRGGTLAPGARRPRPGHLHYLRPLSGRISLAAPPAAGDHRDRGVAGLWISATSLVAPCAVTWPPLDTGHQSRPVEIVRARVASTSRLRAADRVLAAPVPRGHGRQGNAATARDGTRDLEPHGGEAVGEGTRRPRPTARRLPAAYWPSGEKCSTRSVMTNAYQHTTET